MGRGGAPRQREDEGGARPPVAGRPQTIFVVEDDADVRSLVIEVLDNAGYTVISAANAPEALVILRGDADVDLLFTDVVMPGGLSGTELAEEARQIRPGLKVLFTSGYPAHPQLLRTPVLQGELFLEKPYRPTKLLETLRTILTG